MINAATNEASWARRLNAPLTRSIPESNQLASCVLISSDIALGLLYNSVDKVAHLRIGRYKGGILKFLRNLLQRLPRCAPAA